MRRLPAAALYTLFYFLKGAVNKQLKLCSTDDVLDGADWRVLVARPYEEGHVLFRVLWQQMNGLSTTDAGRPV